MTYLWVGLFPSCGDTGTINHRNRAITTGKGTTLETTPNGIAPTYIRDIADQLVDFCDYAESANPAVYAETIALLRRLGELADIVCGTDLNTVDSAHYIRVALLENDGIA